uniref:Uncharacterized protein n=1 Tax=Triticum urartu TaxID=4572 RepID=A0A8R7USS1_TRIUA
MTEERRYVSSGLGCRGWPQFLMSEEKTRSDRDMMQDDGGRAPGGGEAADVGARGMKSGSSAAARRPAVATRHGHGATTRPTKDRAEPLSSRGRSCQWSRRGRVGWSRILQNKDARRHRATVSVAAEGEERRGALRGKSREGAAIEAAALDL